MDFEEGIHIKDGGFQWEFRRERWDHLLWMEDFNGKILEWEY